MESATARKVKELASTLMEACPIEAKRYMGSMGHVYYVSTVPSLVKISMWCRQ